MGDETDGSSSAAQGAHDTDNLESRGILGRLVAAMMPATAEASDEDGPNGTAAGAVRSPLPLGIGNLSRMRVEDVAIPKAEIEAVPLDIGKDDLVRVFRETGMTRLPVYDGTMDTPVGLVHLKDFALRHGFNGKGAPFVLKDMVRPLLYAPPSMPIGVLMQKMQSQRMHMALVIDEYGGVDGLVTIEDLIEQVVGEIEDEHDVDEGALWTVEKPGVYLVQARAPTGHREAAPVGIGLDQRGDQEVAERGRPRQAKARDMGLHVRATGAGADHPLAVQGQRPVDRVDPVELAIEAEQRAADLDRAVAGTQRHVLRVRRGAGKQVKKHGEDRRASGISHVRKDRIASVGGEFPACGQVFQHQKFADRLATRHGEGDGAHAKASVCLGQHGPALDLVPAIGRRDLGLDRDRRVGGSARRGIDLRHPPARQRRIAQRPQRAPRPDPARRSGPDMTRLAVTRAGLVDVKLQAGHPFGHQRDPAAPIRRRHRDRAGQGRSIVQRGHKGRGNGKRRNLDA